MTPRESMRVLKGGLSTGEVKDDRSFHDLQIENKKLKDQIGAVLMRVGKYEAEDRREQDMVKNRDDIVAVADYWAKRVVEEGWWSRTPLVNPGSQRWVNIGARLQDHPTYDCYLVVEGAVLQDRKQTRREWIDATSLFRNEENFDKHYERAKDPMLERVRSNLIELPRDVPRKTVEQLLERCDCGHRFYDHAKQLFTDEGKYVDDDICGLFACSGCDCMHFGQEHQRAEQWIREQIELRRKGHELSDSAKAALEVPA